MATLESQSIGAVAENRARSSPGPGYLAANVAILLVVALLGVFVVLSYRWDHEEQRRSLIADILWVEQNSRFFVETDAASLVALGQEAANGKLTATAFENRARHLKSNSPELLQ